jgi:hypothetical protein
MAPECTFVRRNGRKCRAAANRNQAFCRHHAPKPALDGPPPIAKRNIYTNLARWRALGCNLRWLDPAEIPFNVYEILSSLTGADPRDHISDLIAGRYLRALLTKLGEVPFPQPGFEPSAAPTPAAPPPALPPRAQPQPATPPTGPAPSLSPAVLEAIDIVRNSGLKFTPAQFAEYIIAVHNETSPATASLHVMPPSRV